MGKTRVMRERCILASMTARQLGSLAAAACALTASPRAFGEDDRDAARVVAALEHVRADYGVGLAPRDRYERNWDEQLGILEALSPALEGMKAHLPNGLNDLDRLRREVRSLDPVEVVAAHAARLADEVAAVHKLDRLPAAAPDRERGRAVYLEHCATCHGRFGEADTARARSLEPRPPPFVGEATPISPRRAWESVTFGVPGTAMVAHGFLAAPVRWDVAYVVAALRHRERASTPAPTFAPAELALLDDADLATRLLGAGVSDSSLPGMLANVRTRQAFARACEGEPIGCTRDRLVRARQALSWGDRDAAARWLSAAHLEGVWPGFERLGGPRTGDAIELDERLAWLRGRVRADLPEHGIRDVDTILARTMTAELRALALPPATFLDGVRFGARSVLPACLGSLALVLGRPPKERTASARGVALAAATAILLGFGWAVNPAGLVSLLPWLAVGPLAFGLAALFLRFAPRLPRLTSRADVTFAGAWGLALGAGHELARHASAGAQSATVAEGAGMVLAGVAATTAVVLGSELPEVRSPAFRRMFWLACAMPVAARLGGDLGWALVTLGVVGGPVYAWPGSPALGVHPSACSVLTLGVALVATAILGWRAGRSSSSERS